MYKGFFKRFIDISLSTIGIIVLIPVWIILAIAIKMDDPGPVFFRQKRIARDKDGKQQFFQIFKYRSMKMSTPHDVPTHMLDNPEQYITRIGSFLRKTSLDGYIIGTTPKTLAA
jgi:O-antigen biosynthesis protein WbqP